MYTYAAITDIGPYYEKNDDRILVADEVLSVGESSGSWEKEYFLTAICDGVGGLDCGYEAAQTGLLTIRELSGRHPDRSSIRSAVETANTDIRMQQEHRGLVDGMRTTLAGISVYGKDAYVFNAGDSRVYLYRKERIHRLSKDHSVVQELIDVGKLTEEEARMYPGRNLITKCLGEEDRVNARIIDMTGEVEAGDVFLLCTDGMTDSISDMELEELLQAGAGMPLPAICRQMIDRAIKNGATDNISVCIFRKEK